MANPPKLCHGLMFSGIWLRPPGSLVQKLHLHQHSVGNLLQYFQRRLNHLLTYDFFLSGKAKLMEEKMVQMLQDTVPMEDS